MGQESKQKPGEICRTTILFNPHTEIGLRAGLKSRLSLNDRGSKKSVIFQKNTLGQENKSSRNGGKKEGGREYMARKSRAGRY